MTCEEFSNEFDLFYNNIMSNQAPGLNEYEKSVFLTKAQDDIIKKYFTLKGNKYNEDFDGSIKRNIDFSKLYNTFNISKTDLFEYINILDYVDIVEFKKQIFQNVTTINNINSVREGKSKDITCYEIKGPMDDGNGNNYYSYHYYLSSVDCKRIFKGLQTSYVEFYTRHENNLINGLIVLFQELQFLDNPSDIIVNSDIQINNNLIFSYKNISDLFLPIQDELTVYDTVAQQNRLLQIQPLGNLEYIQKMSKPFKQPIKNQAWKIQTKAESNHNSVKLIYGYNNEFIEYTLRYIKRPTPIILTALNNDEGLSIKGYIGSMNNEETPVKINSTTKPNKGLTCLLDEEIHEEILQRAVELAKAAYTGSLGDIVQLGNISGTDIGNVQVPQQQQRQ